MAQLLPIALAVPFALLCGGRLGRISALKLRGLWLFFGAFGIQVVAFPFAFLPWTTGEEAAKPGKEKTIVRGELVMDPERHLCTWKGAPVSLTVTEFLILQSLAARPGHVKSRDQLMDAAYGENVYVDDRTIDSHIKRLRKKFKIVDDAFDKIETLYGIGYRYSEA